MKPMKQLSSILIACLLLFATDANAQVRSDIANLAEDANDNTVIGMALDGLFVHPDKKYALSLDNGSYSKSNGIALQFGYRYNKKWSGDGGFSFSEKSQKMGARISVGREW